MRRWPGKYRMWHYSKGNGSGVLKKKTASKKKKKKVLRESFRLKRKKRNMTTKHIWDP